MLDTYDTYDTYDKALSDAGPHPTEPSQLRARALQNKQATPTAPFLNSCSTECVKLGLFYASKLAAFCRMLTVSGAGAVRVSVTAG